MAGETKYDPATVLGAMPWWEKAIAVVSPETGLRRAAARVQRHAFEYEASRTDRLYAPRSYGYPAESSQTARNRITMMWEARDLVENSPTAKAVLSKFSNSIVPREYSPQTGDKKTNDLYSDYFHAWCKRCDITSRHSFRKILQLAAEMRPVDGDCGIIIRRIANEVKLQLVAGDRIGNPYDTAAASNGNFFSGITVNDYGAPIMFDVWHVVPVTGQYDKKEQIPQRFFRHYYDPFREDQYRGVTIYHPVIQTIRMQKETFASENAAMRFKSNNLIIVKNERGQANPRQAFQTVPQVTLPSGQPQFEQHQQAGTMMYLKNGDDVTTMPARPGDGFLDYNDQLDHQTARGLDIPYSVLFGTDGYKGPNVRAEMAQADRVFERHRGVMEDQLTEPIKNAVILNAIAEGELPLPPAQEGDDLPARLRRALKGEWRYPAKLTIDVGNQSQADLNEHRQGIKSGQQIASERGYDYSFVIRQKAEEAKMIKDLAVEFDVPETAIALPVQQLPQTIAGAAVIGEKAGQDAASAQAASVGTVAGDAEAVSDIDPTPNTEDTAATQKRTEARRRFETIRNALRGLS